MSETIKFEHVSDYLTNITQNTVVQKIGSYFKIPQKMIRAASDENSLKEGVLRFPQFKDTFDEEFYPVSYKLKVGDLLSEKKLVKSKLWELYTVAPKEALFTIAQGSSVFVLAENSILGGRGVSGIYMDYDCFDGAYLLLPIKTYLARIHPLPLD